MSAPSRGRGGSAKANSSATSRGRGSGRANFSNSVRGRGRGRGGHGGSLPAANTHGAGLLQQLRNGTVQRSSEDGVASAATSAGRGKTVRGRASATRSRGSLSKSFNPPVQSNAANTSVPSSPAPAASNHRDFMAQMTDKFTALKSKREAERKRAIHDGFLADPDKKTNLANAITPVGTCTEMCPEFERVERIVQNMVDKAEKVPNEATGRDMPSQERMVKRFRRSAAGYDEQLPSDIRTPSTLKRTLDYLLDRVIGGGERLATIHKFVWDRTRGIRNDFSIQQVTKPEDVSIAVECYERIARFHILSLHQLSNPDNLLEGEHFDAHQEREQLNNTLISLMFYYEDHRDRIPLPNEPEFRSYLVLFELQALTPDLEERMQSWPRNLLYHPKVQAAFSLYTATSNTVFEQGPLRPLTPFTLAQANSGKFWRIMASQEISYMMACVAEMNFAVVRFTALDALWRSGKSAPQGQQAKNYDWTAMELMSHLGFDDEEQTVEFVQEFGLAFANSPNGDLYLDFTASTASALDKTSLPSKQIFSYEIVEIKRYRRTLVAVINNINVATAIKHGLVVEASDDGVEEDQEEGSSLFFPESTPLQPASAVPSFSAGLNPFASSFQPLGTAELTNTPSAQQPAITTKFGERFGKSAQASGSGSSTPASFFQEALDAVERQAAPDFGFNTSGFCAATQPVTTNLASPVLPSYTGGTPNQLQSTISEPNKDATQANGTAFTFGKPSVLFTPQSQNESEVKSLPSGQIGYVFGKPVQLSQPSTTVPSVGNLATTSHPNSGGKPQGGLFASSANVSSNPFINPKNPITDASSSQILASALPVVSAPAIVSPAPYPGASKPTTSSIFSFPPSQPTQPSPSIQNNSPELFAFQPPPAQQSSQAKPPATTQTIFSAPQPAAAPAPKAPVFDFGNPSIPSQKPAFAPQKAVHPTNLEREATTTTPAGSPKRPSFGDIKFPSVTEAKPTGFQNTASNLKSPAIASAPVSQALTQVSDAGKVASHVEVLPAKPSFTEADRTRLVENASRIALVQPQGILEYLIGNHVSSILQRVVRDYQRDLNDKIIAYIKTRFLSRKFFAAWKSKVRQASLKRRAQTRRQMLAAMMRAESEKKKRNETELEEILAATQETKKLQEQQRRLKQEEEEKKKKGRPGYDESKPEAGQLAGTKRKVISASGNHVIAFRGAGGERNSLHKRSRTLDTDAAPTNLTGGTSLRSSSSTQSSTAPPRFSQPLFGRSYNSPDFRRAMSTQKVDQTRTDYFKLKAMGIDPEAPLIPDTAASLAAKQRKREEERQLLMSRVRGRRGSSTSSLRSVQAFPQASPQLSQSVVAAQGPIVQDSVAQKPVLSHAGEEDEFLRQLRQARKDMAEDAKWFKAQTEELEQEFNRHEELRRSRRSTSSHDERVQVSASGLARSNGFEYRPSEISSGSSLSRTERRIRATGAHGLATKSVGERFGGHAPIAMSKRNASRHNSSGTETPSASFSTVGRKRTRQEQGSMTEDEPVDSTPNFVGQRRNVTTSSPPSKQPRARHARIRGKGRDTRTYATTNMFANLDDMNASDSEQDQDNEDDSNTSARLYRDGADRGESEEEELLEEEEEYLHVDTDNTAHAYSSNLGESAEDGNYAEDEEGDSAGEEEEDDDEDDDEEAEEEEGGDDEVADGRLHTYGGMQPGFGYPPISESSTAILNQVGPGASADDAFVLSD